MELEILQKEMIVAMKAKDKPRKDAISTLVSAVKKVSIDEKCRDNVPEELVDRVILKELKSVKEQIDTCPPDRTELLKEYEERYNLIKEYAPSLMSGEEVKDFILNNFFEVAASKNKGQIMKAIMGDLKGKADGKVINEVVASICQ